MDLHLLFHNIGFIASAVVFFILGIFVYLRDRKSLVNITFALASLSAMIFCVSHVLGVNTADSQLSRDILMWNLSVIFIAVFLTHCIFSIIDITKRQKFFLISMYSVAVVLTAFYIIYPNTFLLPSVPKMYFPDYYVAGPLQWVMRAVFSVFVPVYFLSCLVMAYRRANAVIRNRLKYLLVAIIFGFGMGSMAIFLVFDIPVDPLYASPCGIFFAIPFSYAIVRYNLMDIRILAKRALLFAVIVVVTSFGIFIVGYSNYIVVEYIPGFPLWLFPVLAGCIATAIGIFVWNKFRESDMLKYEFVTIMTHKLRTPLTSIKWSAENLSAIVPEQGKAEVHRIEEGVNRLVELTNVLADVSSEDENKYDYHYKELDFTALCRDIATDYAGRVADKGIALKTEGISKEPILVRVEADRLKSALQILFDNAVTYTSKGGTVNIMVRREDHNVVLSVVDTGIGIARGEIHHIFSRLYRTDTARKTDTEGVGVGLYIAKKIIERHDGRIWAESDGPGKGSTFFVSLPVRKTV